MNNGFGVMMGGVKTVGLEGVAIRQVSLVLAVGGQWVLETCSET